MVVAYLFILIVIVIGTHWLINIAMLSKWKHNELVFVINTSLFIIYTLYLIFGHPWFIGHDEYGIQRLWFIITTPTIHVLLNFLLSLVIRLRFCHQYFSFSLEKEIKPPNP
tara:strand:+ start:137 stop:469 length:333 start_codon:yes stop_codon:yes gene_type:complete